MAQGWLSIHWWENTPDTKNTVVCEDHWPDGYKKITVRSKERPASPPTIFESIPPSGVPHSCQVFQFQNLEISP